MWYLVGFKGCGKSAAGRRLAELLGQEFVDLDAEIERVYAEAAGKRLPFRQIYRELGDGPFRELERRTLEQLRESERALVAVGGGTPLVAANRRRMKETGRVVYIQVEPDELYRRIMAEGAPAFFVSDDPRKEFDSLYAERVGVYEAMADLTVDTTGLGIEESAQKIYEVLTGSNE